MPDLTNQQLTIAIVVTALLALIAVASTLVSSARLRRLRREYAILRGEEGERDIFAALAQSLRRVEGLDHRVDGLTRSFESQTAVGRGALQRFGLVRFDAFEDMGGRLSFSVALLDDHGDGVIVTSINGRTETRTYAKPVTGLSSDHNLSDEEREAIAVAVGGHDRGQPRSPASQPA